MYKKIIVPIDLGQKQQGVGALDLAKKLLDDGGEIILINVVEDIPQFIAGEMPDGLVERSITSAKDDLKKVAETTGVSTKIEVVYGSPASAILETAESSGAGLIVVASHRPGLADYFLGSTAGRIVRHAKCPVFVNR